MRVKGGVFVTASGNVSIYLNSVQQCRRADVTTVLDFLVGTLLDFQVRTLLDFGVPTVLTGKSSRVLTVPTGKSSRVPTVPTLAQLPSAPSAPSKHLGLWTP
jgi:hypothetical protein